MKRSMTAPPKTKPTVKKQKNKNTSKLEEKVVLSNRMYREKTVDNGPKSSPITTSEFEELDHLMVNLTYTTDQIMSKFQFLKNTSLKEVARKNPKDATLQILCERPRILFAAMMVKEFWNNGIPLFDDLLSLRYQQDMPFVNELPAGYLSMDSVDALQANLLEAARQALINLKTRAAGEKAFFTNTCKVISDLEEDISYSTPTDSLKDLHTRTSKDSKDNVVSFMPQNAEIPDGKKNLSEITAIADRTANDTTTPAESNSDSVVDTAKMPPLPEIRNKKLLERVFTHRSALVDTGLITTGKVIHLHNERLELRGDSILDFFVCDMLFNNFPEDDEGLLTIKKANLVCNNTLFDLSVAYGLHKKIKLSSDMHAKVFTSLNNRIPDVNARNKAIADLLEAYIAGVAIDRGLMVVKDWLYKLFRPFIAIIEEQKPEVGLDKTAKNELYRKVGSANQSIIYETDDRVSPFTVRCIINGEIAGTGTDRSIKNAGLRAAANVLSNNELVEKFARSRRSIPKQNNKSNAKSWS